jgi:transcriptional regulator with XRE-family HTH domain
MRSVDRGRLGDRIRTRRRALGLSVSRAARAAGINRATWTAVEDGSRETEPYNFGPIERVLGWTDRSIDNVLAGGEPALIDDPPPISRNANDAEETLHQIAVFVRSKLPDSTVRVACLELIEIWEQDQVERSADEQPEPQPRSATG